MRLLRFKPRVWLQKVSSSCQCVGFAHEQDGSTLIWNTVGF